MNVILHGRPHEVTFRHTHYIVYDDLDREWASRTLEGLQRHIDEWQKRRFEADFGSDEAYPVTYTLEDGTPVATPPDNTGTNSLLPHGGSACRCTDYAIHIYRALPGRVKIYGFSETENPGAYFFGFTHCDGHDFAVVDDKWIVDPWPRLVPACFEQMVFELADSAQMYGPQACWRRQHGVEKHAESLP